MQNLRENWEEQCKEGMNENRRLQADGLLPFLDDCATFESFFNRPT
jgi:hypothetical protein